MLNRLVHLAARLRAMFRPAPLDRDLDEEFASHLAILTDEHLRRGMTPADAERAARLAIGGLTQLRDAHRDTRGLPVIETFLRDLRYAFRTLRRDAGFTTFAILIVGLGIGASATVFSVLNTLLLRPLPYAHADRLVWMWNLSDDGVTEWSWQVGHFLDLRAQSRSFEDLAGYFAYGTADDFTLNGSGGTGGSSDSSANGGGGNGGSGNGGGATRVSSIRITQNFFAFLGVQPAIGRTFTAEESLWNGPRAVMLSDALWRSRFASDPAIAGRTITLNETAYTVVGVLPASFDFSTVFAPGVRRDIYLPMALVEETNQWGNILGVIGRLRPGVTLDAARAESRAIAEQLEREHPERNTFRPRMSTLPEHVAGRFRPALIVLACAVGVVMLIVCANLSNLLLARAASRQKEIAIRTALGASRGRLMAQMLTESVVLSCGGAALGLTLAVFGTRALASLPLTSIPMLDRLQVDGWTLAFTTLAAVVTGLIFGVAPALQLPASMGGEQMQTALKDSARGSTHGAGRTWIRGALAVSEIALACVLLVGAGLLIRSLLRVLDVDLGYRPARAASMRVDPSRRLTTQEQRNAYYDQILSGVRAIPGVSSASLADVLPLGGDRSWNISGRGQVYARGHYPEGFARVVSDGYLETLGLRLLAGRDFTEHDRKGSDRVIIVNQTLARTLWPGQDPIGQIMTQDGGRRVIGLVGDVRHRGLETAPGAEMYMPLRQSNNYGAVYLVVRTDLPEAGLASAVRAVLGPIDSNLPANEWRTLQHLVDKAVSPRRVVVWLLAGFSGFALVLASLGIYAVIAYSVGQRTQEIGIRIALGASAGTLQAGIILQTLKLAALGLLIGVAASWALGRMLSGLLFGVTATDPVTFLAMLGVLTLVAALAGYIPARRASRIDPITALRAQ
jgi:predicted permease